ncbi:blast:Peptidoglycan-recognition protein LF [Drosophila guanche]|uniref:Blast:Peptidoglycan-recognition protein LF n=1 Tax=Drosophila guanche TaxID=7266 RepID=A0A3B0KNK7_DROGU|nr:blast:Peptidoglycan-recognition protein LF [Drosophila guanche]
MSHCIFISTLIHSFLSAEADIVTDGALELIKIKDWGGMPTRGKPDLLKLPVSRVIISHTASEGCESLEVCSYRARVTQSYHMDSFNWDQVGYNFMVGGDGRVYEGRGWDIQGAHALRHNRDSIGITFMGSFDKIKPTAAQLRACQLLIEEGVRLKKLKPDYKLYAHRQLVATKSPGDEVYKIIKTWPHWEDSPHSLPDQDNIGGGLILRFVHRQAWLAQPPQKTLPDLTLPVSLVIVLPTNSDNCTTQAQCVLRVRLRQTFDIESLQEDDIAFNFVLGGDGNVYVGRGWDQVGAHMSGYNTRSLSFAYIGSFQNQKPSAKQLSVTKLLLERGVSLGKISPNYRLTGASKLEPSITEYKAEQLYQSFGNWSHWS